MAKPAKVYLWENGMVMVFDESGCQIPELQGRFNAELHSKITDVSDDSTCWLGFDEDGPLIWKIPND